MEEYSAIFRRVFVPSLTLALAAAASALVASSRIIDGSVSTAGAVLLVLTAASVIPVYRNSLRHGRRGGDVVRLVCMVIAAAALAVFVALRVATLAGSVALPAERRAWSGRIEALAQKRYWQEAEVRLRGEGADEGRAAPVCVVRIRGGRVLHAGDLIEFTARPVALAAGRGTPFPRRDLILRGIHHAFYPEAGGVRVLSSRPTLRERIRACIAARCDLLFDRGTAALVKSLYFGNHEYIGKATLHAYRRAGVMHVLAASGLHVGVVAAVPLFLLGLARINRKAALAFTAGVVFAYLYLTDMPVSLVRASVMFFLFALQKIADRDVGAANALFMTAALILAIFPGDVYALGFQLSFGATLGILLFHGPYRNGLAALPRPAAGFLAVTLAAQAAVMPILIIRAGELNLNGLAANLIVVPLVSLVLVASLAAHALSCVAAAGLWAGRAVNLINGGADLAVGLLSGMGGHFAVGNVSPALVAAGCMFLLPLVTRPALRRYAPISLLAAAACAWISLGLARAERPPVTVFRHAGGVMVMAREEDALSIAGSVPAGRARERLMQEIAAESPSRVRLFIPRADYRGIAGHACLAERLPVRECILDRRFRLGGPARRLFEVLERDGAGLQICDLAAGGAGGEAMRLYRLLAHEGDRASSVRAAKSAGARYLTLQ